MTTYKEMQEKINMNESVNDLSKAGAKVRVKKLMDTMPTLE